jgi:hypothetical protein
MGGTTNMGGEGGIGGVGGVAGDTGMAGDTGVAGEGGMAGAGGAPPIVEPQVASPHWLGDFCDAKSVESLGCENSPEWDRCFRDYRPFLSTVNEGVCEGEGVDGQPNPKTDALTAALDALAEACPDPTVDQWQCTLGAPQAKDQACRDADEARRIATMNCGDVF